MNIGGGELEYDYKDFSRPKAGDDKLAIRFFRKAKQDADATVREKRPIFVEVEYIQIMVPGDKGNVIVRPVSPNDIGRFQRQYDHWKKTNQEEMLHGTPLETWGVLNLAQIEEFRYFGIRTIEHMAALRDDVASKIMGALALKQKALAWLEATKGAEPLQELSAALAKRDEQINALLEAQKAMAAELAALKAGRPSQE